MPLEFSKYVGRVESLVWAGKNFCATGASHVPQLARAQFIKCHRLPNLISATALALPPAFRIHQASRNNE